MRQRINAETDFNILADLALGIPAKEVALKYNVSVSYVSKVKTGRKKINVYIPEQAKEINQMKYYESDVDKLIEFFDTTPLSLQTSDTNTLDGLIIQRLSELKVLLRTRKLLIKEKD